MATATEIGLFIQEIAPCAQQAYKTLGKVKPSVCIGMGMVESAYGTSQIMRKHNAFFGQKVGTGKTATKYWGGSFFTSKTSEEYTVGTHTIITSAFRAYESMQQGVLNFYELLNTSLYAKVKADADYATQMQQIKTCGYMTSSTEVNSVLKLISTYNLTQYDDVCTETGTAKSNPYTLTATLLKRGCTGDNVKWLQWHLNAVLGTNLVIDGVYGANTENAVKTYQKAHNLTVDGIVGAKTINALKSVI